MITETVGSADLMMRVKRVSEAAMRSGKLKSIRTELTRHREQGVDFQIRILTNIGDKEEAGRRLSQAGSTNANPFLPYDRDLYVGELTENRLILLNKYNVIDHHLLIVSGDYEDQRLPLGEEDFVALSLLMAKFPSLGFYNGGKEAGASQMHRHLQVVPLQKEGVGRELPLDLCVSNGIDIDYKYRIVSGIAGDPYTRAAALLGFYQRAIREFGLVCSEKAELLPYNLLVWQDRALLVPRRTESVAGISVNSLGYAGTFLVRNQQQRQALIRRGLLNSLAEAGVPTSWS